MENECNFSCIVLIFISKTLDLHPVRIAHVLLHTPFLETEQIFPSKMSVGIYHSDSFESYAGLSSFSVSILFLASKVHF